MFLLEAVTIGPQLVAPLEACLEDFNFRDLLLLSYFEHLFILLVLLNLRRLSLELSADLG